MSDTPDNDLQAMWEIRQILGDHEGKLMLSDVVRQVGEAIQLLKDIQRCGGCDFPDRLDALLARRAGQGQEEGVCDD